MFDSSQILSGSSVSFQFSDFLPSSAACRSGKNSHPSSWQEPGLTSARWMASWETERKLRHMDGIPHWQPLKRMHPHDEQHLGLNVTKWTFCRFLLHQKSPFSPDKYFILTWRSINVTLLLLLVFGSCFSSQSFSSSCWQRLRFKAWILR